MKKLIASLLAITATLTIPGILPTEHDHAHATGTTVANVDYRWCSCCGFKITVGGENPIPATCPNCHCNPATKGGWLDEAPVVIGE
jgi:hypothetical protein